VVVSESGGPRWDRLDIYFGSERLAVAKQMAREWMNAFERRQQQNK
jgi:hypothetical protein